MTIVVNKETGEVLYGSVIKLEPKENEVHIEHDEDYNFVNGYYNFETKEFYEGATQEELNQIENDNT